MQDCTTIEGILKMLRSGCTYEEIRNRFTIGSSVITDIKKKFKKMNMSIEDLELLPAEEVQEKFYPDVHRRQDKPLPDYKHVYLVTTDKQSRGTLFGQWNEYKEKHPDGYQYSQYKKYYADWRKEHHIDENYKMSINRGPGQILYLDWIGDTLQIVRNPDDPDKPLTAHFFVAAMGVSGYTFCEAFPNEKTPYYARGVVDALSFMGALPYILKPDNPKTVVKKNSKDELILNATIRDIEHYYNVVVVPAPPHKPKGKSLVENDVGWLERNLLMKLRNRMFNSFDELNEAVSDEVNKLNLRPYTNAKGNRKEMFIEYDKPAMRPLTMPPFTCYDYKYCKVPNNYHISIDDHYYSVPYTYYSCTVLVRTSPNEIIITDENNRLICKHKRLYARFPKYSTKKEHMPPNHQYYYEENNYTAQTYINWAASIGPNTRKYVARIIASFEYEQQSYKSCNGLLHMISKKPKALAEEAARRCLEKNVIGYSYFKRVYNNIIKELDGKPSADITPELPKHKNIRGKDSFK